MQISHPWGAFAVRACWPVPVTWRSLGWLCAGFLALLCWRAAGPVGVSSCWGAMNLIAAGGGEADAAGVGHVHGLTGLERAGQGRLEPGRASPGCRTGSGLRARVSRTLVLAGGSSGPLAF